MNELEWLLSSDGYKKLAQFRWIILMMMCHDDYHSKIYLFQYVVFNKRSLARHYYNFFTYKMQ
ncbi:hypothetical protein D5074_21480 [Pectobacterium polaris]|nr:hypothetical protein DF209_02200 [Pectobacterium polaris]RJL18249.1 hypothetical protein D5074_21480 [Pectobacterium polaris]